MKYGLSTDQLLEIKAILSKYKEIKKASIFGSRAIDTYKEASDVDIVVFGDDVSSATIANLKDDFEESYIPFFFDVLAYKTIKSDELIKHIDIKGKVFYGMGEWR